jgi:hypothetical protein
MWPIQIRFWMGHYFPRQCAPDSEDARAFHRTKAGNRFFSFFLLFLEEKIKNLKNETMCPMVKSILWI